MKLPSVLVNLLAPASWRRRTSCGSMDADLSDASVGIRVEEDAGLLLCDDAGALLPWRNPSGWQDRAILHALSRSPAGACGVIGFAAQVPSARPLDRGTARLSSIARVSPRIHFGDGPHFRVSIAARSVRSCRPSACPANSICRARGHSVQSFKQDQLCHVRRIMAPTSRSCADHVAMHGSTKRWPPRQCCRRRALREVS